MRNLRQQSGSEYPSKFESFSLWHFFIGKAAQYFEKAKNMEEQNSQVLVNMARICESEAKRKEQLISVKSSANMDNTKQINQM